MWYGYAVAEAIWEIDGGRVRLADLRCRDPERFRFRRDGTPLLITLDTPRGTVLPWDHPFWRTHYPPNGWRCRCAVQQLGKDDLERFGLEVSENPPDGWDTARPWRDRRNGETHQIPRHRPGLRPQRRPRHSHRARRQPARRQDQ